MSEQPPGVPYGQNPSDRDPYGQDPYGQNPYGQPTDPHGRPYPDAYGQAPQSAPPPLPPYTGAPYGVAPYTAPPFGPPPPKHPSATTAMILGLVGLIGGFTVCGLPLVVSPFAWATGSRAVKDIDASQGRISGRDEAMIGKVTGIIGTVLLIIALMGLAVFIALVVTTDSTVTTNFEEF